MSMTLATMADALIEFILSLLRDPDSVEEFDADPAAMLSARGLNNVSAADVCGVAPVIVERAQVVPAPPAPGPGPGPSPDPVIREIKNIVSNFAWVDDRDTIVDQSVNQNIWADGDVTQLFDNDAVVASGDDSMAAGEDVEIDQTEDNSTNIEAGGDANVGNDTEVTIVDDSFNQETDASTTTETDIEVEVDDSLNDESTTVEVDDSLNTTTEEYTQTEVDIDADIVSESSETLVAEDVSVDEEL